MIILTANSTVCNSNFLLFYTALMSHDTFIWICIFIISTNRVILLCTMYLMTWASFTICSSWTFPTIITFSSASTPPTCRTTRPWRSLNDHVVCNKKIINKMVLKFQGELNLLRNLLNLRSIPKALSSARVDKTILDKPLALRQPQKLQSGNKWIKKL